MRRTIKELDKEMAEIKAKFQSGAFAIEGFWVDYSDENGFTEELKWMNGQLPMANIEISQGGKFTAFTMHEFVWEDGRTRKKQRLVTQSLNEAFSKVKELLA